MTNNEILRHIRENSNDSKITRPLWKFYHYIKKHLEHISYGVYKQNNLPIGSGIVESACKYLIQQRFKGVGMRWSTTGFDNLLQLRLAWMNDRFDIIFDYQFHTLRFYVRS